MKILETNIFIKVIEMFVRRDIFLEREREISLLSSEVTYETKSKTFHAINVIVSNLTKGDQCSVFVND